MGLPPAWRTVREQIMTSQPEELNLGSVLNILKSNIDVVAAGSTTNTSASGTGNTDALISTTGLKKKPYHQQGKGKHSSGSSSSKVSKRDIDCFHCGRKGHVRKDCRGRINGEKAMQRDKERRNKGKGKEQEKQQDNDGDIDALIAAADQMDIQYASTLVAATTARKASQKPQAWLIDTGAGTHITFEERDLVKGSYKHFPSPRMIGVGDERLVPCYGAGIVTLPGLTLSNVWLAPKMGYRLFSQDRMANEGYSLILRPNGTGMFLHEDTGKVVKTAKISHPTLHELVFDNFATAAVADAQPLEAIDSDNSSTDSDTDSNVDTQEPQYTDPRSEYQAFAGPSTQQHTQESVLSK